MKCFYYYLNKWDSSLTDNFVDENNYTQFGDSPLILWKNIDRWNHTYDEPPSPILYTLFPLKGYFFIFVGILVSQALTIFLAKILLSHEFCQQQSIIEKFIHVMENCHIGFNAKEWDAAKGNAKAHQRRMLRNQKEVLTLIIINFFYNILLLSPLIILG